LKFSIHNIRVTDNRYLSDFGCNITYKTLQLIEIFQKLKFGTFT